MQLVLKAPVVLKVELVQQEQLALKVLAVPKVQKAQLAHKV